MVERLTTFIPYAPASDAMNLGAEYNRHMRNADTEWVCFLDHDAMWLRSDWMPRIIHHINSIDNLGLLTTRTNRIGSPAQRWKGYESEHNIFKLRKAANRLPTEPTKVTGMVSGVVIITSRTAWVQAGGFDPGFLGVDWAYLKPSSGLDWACI